MTKESARRQLIERLESFVKSGVERVTVKPQDYSVLFAAGQNRLDDLRVEAKRHLFYKNILIEKN